MLPLMPRRRSRRRSVSGRLVVLVVVVLVIALLIGGLTQISRQSHAYEATSNRSLVSVGTEVVVQSNATSIELRRLMTDLQTLDRSTLQSELDEVVQQAANESSRASRASGSMGAAFASVFLDRAHASSELRSAVDGLLGMHPLPVAGVPVTDTTGASTPTLLSSTEATNRIAAAGSLLTQSDQDFHSLRQALVNSYGHAHLPPSVWVTDAQVWQIGSVATQVDLASMSPSLAATHDLVLRTVRLSPPALPTVNGTPTGPSVLSPTTTVSVAVVVSNLGSVDEPHASVQLSLTPQPSGTTVTQVRAAAITSGGSVTLDAVTFVVVPGMTYLLTVSIVVPVAQISLDGTSLQKVLEIAPGT
jgi:DNA-binding transcriptional regulator of glucitol operon